MFNPKATPFSDWPHDQRMDLRAALSDLNACVDAYTGDGITISLPRCWDLQDDIADTLRSFGLSRVGAHYFPLGSDNPSESMRHDNADGHGRKGCRGYWKRSAWVPSDLILVMIDGD